jgi:flagellar hook-basal body complex protein FliE
MAALVDQANLNEVVTAVSEAETALQTVAAIRDRIIESYKEIMRMPI